MMDLNITFNDLSSLLEMEPGTIDMREWKNRFNQIASELEFREFRDDDEIDDDELYLILPTSNVVAEWRSVIIRGKLYIVSPPVLNGTIAVRLSVDVINPVMDKHVMSYVFDLNDDMTPRWDTMSPVCLVTNEVGASLLAIFALWDHVARVGIREAMEVGIIEEGWVDNVFCKTSNLCSRERLLVTNTRLVPETMTDRDVELARIESFCRARGITSEDLIGFEYIANPGDHVSNQWKMSSWIYRKEGDIFACRACNECIHRMHSTSIETHVRSRKHMLNAAIKLLTNP